MADVTPGANEADDRRGRRGRRGRRDRAQILLVAAVGLAVTMVALALILNTVIFTENLATRAGDTTEEHAVRHQQMIERGIGGTLNYINNNNTENASFSTLNGRLQRAVRDWNTTTGRHAAADGTVVNVRKATPHYGTRILQTNESRNFTAGGDIATQSNWSVVEDVRGMRRATLNVSNNSLFGVAGSTTKATLTDDAFHVNVTNGSHTWRIFLFQGAITGTTYILVEDPDEDFANSTERAGEFVREACASNERYVRIRIEQATVEGQHCESLTFFGQLDPGVSIYYNQTTDDTLGDLVRGRYELLVNETSVDQTPYYDASQDRSPFTLTAVYSANVETTYRTAELTHTTSRTVVATDFGRFGPIGSLPTVTQFDVTDKSGGTTAEFEVDWTVFDKDGDLDEVQLLFADNDTGLVHDSESISVSGRSASGSTTLTASVSLSEKYTILITVVDSTGGSATVAEIHEADGDDSGDPP